MNCDEISELLPAYVFGALEPEEMQAVEAHLREGHEHDAELVELRATLFAMDRYQNDLAPAPSQALAARVARIVEPAPIAAPPAPRWLSWLTRSPVTRAAAAVVALLLVFAAGWLAGGGLAGDGDTITFVLTNEDGAFMQVSGATNADSVTVVMDGLQRLEANSYQVWAIRDEAWLSMGVCNTDEEGWWHGDFDFALQEGEDVALTIEPRGGSDRPTSEPLLSTTR